MPERKRSVKPILASSRQVGFVTMGASAGGKKVKEIGVGMLGYAFMGKAHSNAYRKIQYMTWPPPLMPRQQLARGTYDRRRRGRQARNLREAARPHRR